MSSRPEFLSFDIKDGPLAALRWPGIDGAPTVVAVHGLTANAWHFDPLAHHLAGGANIVAVDLRGRGRSYDHAGQFGIHQHADDLAAVAREIGTPVTLVGHSMGAYAALLAAERHPTLFNGVVAVDGGVPVPVPPGDIEQALIDTLGPTISRLRITWPDRVSYQTMWGQHPAFADGIGLDLQRTLLADLIDVPDGFRVAVNEAAVIIDGRDLLVDDEIQNLLVRRTIRTTIVRATAGLLGTPPPFISQEIADELDAHHWVTVNGANHYTVLLGSKGATVIADAIRAELSASTA